MDDDIRKHELRDDEMEEVLAEDELTTADLARPHQIRPAPSDVEPCAQVEEIESRSVTIPGGSIGRGPLNPPATTVNKTGYVGAVAAPALERETGPLFSGNEANELRSRWDTIQVGFVDEPRRAVEQADNLVAGTMKRLAEIFAQERSSLESQWDQGENVSTEDLRLALRRYRSFFSRLLSV
jgi:hypothetical protein